ncbi:MAG: class I SAM-dependent methyltransferase [Emcibacter sp.]|nr:class I SAM-dependent methyltransferase [Emcibacter sp.]
MNQNDDRFIEASLNYYRDPVRSAARRKDYLAPIMSILPRGKLLELGAASGWFIRMASDVGYDAHGIELMPRAIEAGIKELGVSNLRQGTENDIPDEPTFDIIVANNTIEHLIDPELFINKCKAALNNEGIVCFIFPDANSFMAQHLKEYSYYNMPPYHLTHFTEKGMTSLLDVCGFDVELFHEHDEGFYFGHGLAHKIGLKQKYMAWREDPDFIAFDIAIDQAVSALAKKAGCSLNKTVIARKR